MSRRTKMQQASPPTMEEIAMFEHVFDMRSNQVVTVNRVPVTLVGFHAPDYGRRGKRDRRPELSPAYLVVHVRIEVQPDDVLPPSFDGEEVKYSDACIARMGAARKALGGDATNPVEWSVVNWDPWDGVLAIRIPLPEAPNQPRHRVPDRVLPLVLKGREDATEIVRAWMLDVIRVSPWD